MTAFSPGQSPPPVRTPTRIDLPLLGLDRETSCMSVLSIDAGTTGVTALIVRPDGTVTGRGYSEFRQYYPEPGWVEHLPEGIWQATLTACRQALASAGAGPVTCVGITNQRETAVIWDRATLATPRDRLAGPADGAAMRAAGRPRPRCQDQRGHGAEAGSLFHRHEADLALAERASGLGRRARRLARGRDRGLLPGRPADRWPAARHRRLERVPDPAVR